MTLEDDLNNIWNEGELFPSIPVLSWSKEVADADFRHKSCRKQGSLVQLVRARLGEGLISTAPYVRRLAQLVAGEEDDS